MVSRSGVIKNLWWRFAERIGAKGVELIVSIILARLLLPSDYGKIALITVFITILQVFVDSGLGNALIQKVDADDVDFSTVFYFNISFCLLLYCLLYLSAPSIAIFYKDDSLVPVIRVLGITVLVSGIKNVQQAYVSKNMLFRRFFFATLGGTIGAAIIGVSLAYRGFGIWALVAQQILNVTIDTIILWFTVEWRPKLFFSLKRLRSLYSFGWKLLISSLLETVYNELRQLIIGKMYTSSDLAFYNRGKQFPQFITANINTAIDSVLFPTISSEQGNPMRVKAIMSRAIKTSTFVMAPLLVGLGACAESVVKILLTDKWIEVVPYLRIFCITSMFLPIHTSNLNAIKAMGRSDIYLKLEIYKKIVGLLLLLTSMWFGVKAMAYSLLVSSFANQIINSWPNKDLLNYSYREQISDIYPSLLLASFMGFCILQIQRLDLSDVSTLIAQVVVGAIIFIGGSALLKIESYEYVKTIILNFLKG